MTEILKYEGGNLNEYAAHIHELNAHWWQNPDGSPKELDKGERFMLMISELAEAMEGARKNLQDDHLPQFPMIWVELADEVIRVLDSGHVYGWDFTREMEFDKLIDCPQTVGAWLLNISSDVLFLAEAEINKAHHEEISGLAYQVIRNCVEYAAQLGCEDFWNVVYLKLVYNSARPDHKLENRMAPGGKQW